MAEQSLWNELDEDVKEAIVEVLDNQWLVYDIKVTGNQGLAENYMSTLFRIEAKTKLHPIKVVKMILKQMPEDLKLRIIAPVEELFNREIFMYTKMFPAFNKMQEHVPPDCKFEFIKCYKASRQWNKMILMEDVTAKGFKIYKNKFMNMEHIIPVVTYLARYHALSFAMKEKHPGEFTNLVLQLGPYSYYMPYLQYIDAVGENTLNLFTDPLMRWRIERFTKNLSKRFLRDRSWDRADPYNVVCHSDCWRNNMLFKYNKKGKVIDLRIIDWQICTFSSPVTDLAHFLFLNMDSRLKKRWFPTVLDVYYIQLKLQVERLGANMSLCYPRKVYDEHVREIMSYGFTMAMIAIPLHSGSFRSRNLYDASLELIHSQSSFNEECKKRLLRIIRDCWNFGYI